MSDLVLKTGVSRTTSKEADKDSVAGRFEITHRQLTTAQAKLVVAQPVNEDPPSPLSQEFQEHTSSFGPIRAPVTKLGWTKKGPRERRVFERFIYCLPDILSFVPSFTSTVERDLHLKREYQCMGYGYPSRDYNNGYPRPTCIFINQTAEEFRDFLVKLYPNLEGRDVEVYRMDRQKKLLSVVSGTPRELKDMNYKGIIVIIPRSVNGDRQDVPVTSTSSTTDDTGPEGDTVLHAVSVKHLNYRILPQLSPVQHPHVPVTSPATQTRVKQEPVEPTEPSVSEDGTSYSPGDVCKIRSLALLERLNLGAARTMMISRDSFVDDVITFYKDDPSVVGNDLLVFVQNSRNGDIEEMCTNRIFTEFWRKAYKCWFVGNAETVPKLSPLVSRELFVVLGRILAHGLILSNYWPLKLSRACAHVIITDQEASDKLVMDSFRCILSESERAVIKDLEDQVQRCDGYESPATMAQAAIALAPYGCTQLPSADCLGTFLLEMAIQFCYCRPHWPLTQMSRSFKNSSNSTFIALSESDITDFYNVLQPTATSVTKKLSYSYSDNGRVKSFEKSVSSFLEKVLLKLGQDQLRRLLLLWSNTDCLNMKVLHVAFSESDQVSPPVFDGFANEMCLSRYFPSAEVLQEHLETSLEESVAFRL
ncbi:uncharacterized protein LOC124286561 [Haliotis rubra]|uniref:uncharacterized protein LOC124286561 n=1 Tax=Haliotis rubra TaxID=36100 RepID=UPI001EE56C01|nr:uncharacterized protein LOC124286561 [Haliotis rubra]